MENKFYNSYETHQQLTTQDISSECLKRYTHTHGTNQVSYTPTFKIITLSFDEKTFQTIRKHRNSNPIYEYQRYLGVLDIPNECVGLSNNVQL